ncbi:hypothetical protein KKF34_08050 [Myxococcota bacterium]|nr:hypothetical protein [Myxococcota bacterium]MBU1381683.1 hypothetical protein [Myxococcota bacterium]MBU1496813.1 hypothetical protein [Myxococcota bacterium]
MISKLLFISVITSTLISCGKAEEKPRDLKNNKIAMSADYFFPSASSESVTKSMSEIFGKDAALLTGMLAGVESIRVRSWEPEKHPTSGVLINRTAGCMKGSMSFMVFPTLESPTGATLSDGKIHKVYIKRARTENPLYLKASGDIVCLGTSAQTLNEILKLKMDAPASGDISLSVSLNGNYLFSQLDTDSIIAELKRKQQLTDENEKITRKILAEAKHIETLKFKSVLDRDLNLKTEILGDWDKVQKIMEPLADPVYPVYDMKSAATISVKGGLVSLLLDTFLPPETPMPQEKMAELETFRKITKNLSGLSIYYSGDHKNQLMAAFLNFSKPVPEMDEFVAKLRKESSDDKTATSVFKNKLTFLKTSGKTADGKSWYFADYELTDIPTKARNVNKLIDIRGDIFLTALFADGLNISGKGNSIYTAGISHKGKNTAIEINFNIKPLLEIGQKTFEMNKKKTKIPSDI